MIFCDSTFLFNEMGLRVIEYNYAKHEKRIYLQWTVLATFQYQDFGSS